MSAETTKKEVGLIGIGLLGTALAERMLSNGFAVFGYDPSVAAAMRITTLGGRAATSITDVGKQCSTIVLCLPDSDVVDEVIQKLSHAIGSGTLLIDTTTGDPARTIETSKQLADTGIDLVDAAVLGSSEVVRQGDGVLMVGASDTAFAACSQLLKSIGPTVYHLGMTGSGQQMKLVANLVLGLNRAVLAEGLHFARSIGLDMSMVLSILKSGATWSRVMDAKGRKMVDADFEPQARLSQHLKDVRLILSHAGEAGSQLPLSELHRLLLEQVEQDGGGDLDNSAIIQAW